MAGKNESTKRRTPPLMALRADSEFGMRALLVLHHAHSPHISAEEHKTIASMVRAFELWREANAARAGAPEE